MIRDRWSVSLAVVFLVAVGVAVDAGAQPLGTFRWQQQPFCNIVTLSIVRNGNVFELQGYDDQCGASTRGAAGGVAVVNPDGTIGMGLTIVTTPGGAPVHIDGIVSLASVSGTWRDSAGRNGSWVFTPGPGTGGSPRPRPVAVLSLSSYSATPFGATVPQEYGCTTLLGNAKLHLDLPLPVGATVVGMRLKYLDSSPQALTFAIMSIEFTAAGLLDQRTVSPVIQSTDGNPAALGARLSAHTFTLPPVVPPRTYYFVALTPSHTGGLDFCGVDVLYVLL